MIVDNKGRRVGKKSQVLIIACEKGQRIVYKREEENFSYMGEPLIKELTSDCEATIEVKKYSLRKYPFWYFLHTLTIVGNSPNVVRQMVDKMEILFFKGLH